MLLFRLIAISSIAFGVNEFYKGHVIWPLVTFLAGLHCLFTPKNGNRNKLKNMQVECCLIRNKSIRF